MTAAPQNRTELASSEQSGQHFLLLAEYTEKLKLSCARHERIRLLSLSLFLIPIASLTALIAIALAYHYGADGQNTLSLILKISDNSLSIAAISGVVIGYFATLGASFIPRVKQTKREVLDSSRLLSLLLSRASQRLDQELSVDEEVKLEMEIRLVEAENALEHADSLFSHNRQEIAALTGTVLAVVSTVAALLSFP